MSISNKTIESPAVTKKQPDKGVLFCFTDFSGVNVKNGYKKIFEEYKDIIRGISWGKEICPSTKKEHNQGFIQLFKQARYASIQKMIKSKCHFEICHGSILDNETYCSKEGSYTKIGTYVSRGYRSDIHNIKDDLMNNVPLYNIMDNYTGDFLRYHSGIDKMKSLIDKRKRDDMGFVKPEVKVLIGDAGLGKTKQIYEKHGYHNVFKISRYDDLKFMFNGYDNQEVLILDDFNGNVPYTYLLQLLDGYPLDINIKNGVRYNFFNKIYITSNNKPSKWYKNISENLKRRISFCLEVTKGNTESFSHENENFDKFFITESDNSDDEYSDDGDTTYKW